MVSSVPETIVPPVVDAPKDPVAPVVDPAKDPVDPPATDPPAGDPPPTEALYDLPDGRKVNAETLAKEFKENFLPDYTRKSQKVAEFEKIITPPKEEVPEWKKPGYQPQSWAEAIEIAKAEAKADIIRDVEKEEQRIASISTQVETILTELKAKDPQLDENALFVHATKYGFQDLRAAYTNMADLKRVAVDTEQRVLKNIKARTGDPVATAPGAPSPSDAVDMGAVRSAGSALEFLQRLKH